MRRIVRYGFACILLSIFHFPLSTVSAQKYPERRVARDGNKAYNAGDFEAAAAYYRSALETNPELGEARFNLGDAMFRQEKGEEAAKIFIDIAADSLAAPAMVSAANFNAGNVMLSGQKIEEAIEFYKQALRIDPTDMQAKYNLAYAQKLLQNPPPEDQDQQKDDNQDQDQDKNQDQNEDQQDQDQNQDQDDQDGDQDQDQQDQQDGEGDQQQDQDQGEKPEPSDQSGEQEVTIDPQDAEHMLEAMQDEEDKTREKMNAKEVPAVGRSGKNW